MLNSRNKIGLPIYLAALNMRAGLVLIGPLIPILKNYFNLSNSALSILAGLPILCFAATSLVMSRVAKLGSSNRIIKLALTALTLAMIGRATTGLIGLYLFALCMGLAIAVMNYELPAWVKEHAPNDSGYLTGVYVTIMGIAAAVSVAISVPLAEINSLSWRMSMVPWIAISVLTTIYWWIKKDTKVLNDNFVAPAFWRSKAFKNPIAWALVFFFGLESMTFYATATWFPTILTTKNFTLSSAAIALSLSGIIGSAVGVIFPHYFEKSGSQRTILILTSLFTAFSFFMVTVQTGWVIFIWLSLSNIGISIAFPLALMMAGLKSNSPEATRNLSTMMQAFGYSLSATGPYFMAKLHDISNSWDIAMYGVVVICLLQAGASYIVGKPSKIDY